MPASLLFLLIIVSSIGILLGMMTYKDPNIAGKGIFWSALAIFASSLLWLVISCAQPERVIDTILTPCYNVNGVQVIAVKTKDNMDLINVNTRFERNFNEGQIFRVEMLDRYFFGVDWEPGRYRVVVEDEPSC